MHVPLRRSLGPAGLALLTLCAAAGCARPVGRSAVAGPSPSPFTRRLVLNGHSLSLHLQRGDPAHVTPLVVYATGDGGWRGKDRDVYRQIASWGYAAAGFSAPEYLAQLPGDEGTTTPVLVGRDIAQVVDATRDALLLPSTTPVVLVGVSRGADLMVVAAGQPRLQPELAGVIAMGLTREEEYVRRRRQPDVALELYAYLPRLGTVPLSVIQSTRDRYLPAAEARVLFGNDTPLRMFQAVDARDHSFAGARPRLYALLRDALVWAGGHAAPQPGHAS